MEEKSTSTKETSTKDLQFPGCHHKGTSSKTSDRESETPTVAVSLVHSSQEGFGQRTPNSRPIQAQLLYQLPILQNANTKRSETPPTSRILDNINRPERRLLAYSSHTQQTSLPRFLLQRSELAVSSNALWAQHCPKIIHQDHISCGSRTSSIGGLGTTVSRRSPYCSTNKGDLPSTYSTHAAGTEKTWPHCQRQEIQAGSPADVPLARDRLGPTISHSSGLSGQGSDPTSRLDQRGSLWFLSKTNNPVSSGSGQLARPVGSDIQVDSLNNEDHPENMQEIRPEGYHQDTNEPEDPSLQMDIGHSIPSTSGLTPTRPYHSDRCLPQRMGHNSRSIATSGQFRQVNDLFHQCFRTHNSVLCSAPGLKTQSGDTDSVRQSYSSRSITQRRLNLPSSRLPRGAHLEESCKTKLDPSNIAHKGELQCNYRPTLEKHCSLNGVVPLRSGLQTDPAIGASSTSRPFCNESKQQTSNLHFSMSRQTSDCSGCPGSPLGEMESLVPVSTNEFDPKGVSKNKVHIICERNITNTRYSYKTMVHGSQTTRDTLDDPGCSPVSDSGQDSSDTPPTYETSRLAVIKGAYGSRFPGYPNLIDLLAAPIRKSSIKDYEKKWYLFCTYLQSKNIPAKDVTLTNVLGFFTYLFHERNLRPSTVSHYRSALAVPLQLQFGIDLHDPTVSTLIKGMFVQRPNLPAAAPSWSLNKVLAYLDDIPDSPTLDVLLQKTAFLLLLATGWRISELQACVRDPKYCFVNGATLMLRPHPAFMAKNECPKKRWLHQPIRPLQLPNGSPSKLCPVHSLQAYQWKTPRVSKGSLFIHPSTQKPLTVHQLSTSVCKVILAADPVAKASVHDVRKYATSLALAETMDVSDVVTAVNWRSPHTFWKFYMAPMEPLTLPAVLPGTAAMSTS